MVPFRLIISVLALMFSITGAFAQCSGQFASGSICGNSTGGQRSPTGVAPSALFDLLYGTTPGTVIYRGPSGWTSLTGNTSGTQILSENASGVPSWLTVSGTGTVTSVGLATPPIFTVVGGAVTSAGNLTFTVANETANTVWAGPTSGPAAAAAFRGLVIGDFPSIAGNTVIANGTSGSAVPTALSVPSCSSANNALIWTSGTGFGCSTISAGGGSVSSIVIGAGLASTQSPLTTTGTMSLATIAADNLLGNATAGTAAPGAVPLTSCSAVQNALTYNTSSHTFGCNTISGSGTVVSGTAGQLAYYGGSTNVVNGNPDANITAGALTLGVASTTIGQLILDGNTSGSVTLTPQATAGTPTITFGTASGTPAVTASAPLAIASSTGNITITGAAGQVLAGAGPAFTATPTLGASSSATGQLKLAGTTAGTVTFSVQDTAGTWTMKLPTSAGTNGQFLETDGAGNASWASPSGSGTVDSGIGGQLAYYATNGTVLDGNPNVTVSSGVLSLGQSASTIGKLTLFGNTSGSATIAPQATAGSPVITLGTSSGTPAVTASAPLAITTATGNISITGVAGQVLAGAGPAFTATPTLGAGSVATGQLKFSGTTSGTVTLSVLDAAGTWTMKLPSTAGTSGQVLQTDGSGNTSWTSAAGGGVTSVGSGYGLTGGPITSTGTLSSPLLAVSLHSMLGGL